MSDETYRLWDVAEIPGSDEIIFEYLRAALEECDREYFAKAVDNVARAAGQRSCP